MSRLDTALVRLAERGDPIGPDVLIARLERQLTSEATPQVVALETRRRAVETSTTAQRPTRWWRGPRLALGAAAVIVLLAGAAFAIATWTDTNRDVAASDPAATILAYIDAYNARDIDAVMELFTEDSVMIGHPFSGESIGLTAIRAVQAQDIDGVGTDDAYTISNVQVAGNSVTWDHVWRPGDGGESCQYGHSAIVEDGKILSWTWPGGGFSCRP